jgi:hypothetical protein
MESPSVRFIVPLFVVMLLYGCDLGKPLRTEQPLVMDQQVVKVFLKYSYRDQVDTFNGTLTKDLVTNGTITVSFSFTATQQDSILLALAQSDFFNLPDTLHPIPNAYVSPNPGPQILRVQYQGNIKSLVWFYLLDASDLRSDAVMHLWQTIWRIVQSTDTYKRLPPAVGGYL